LAGGEARGGRENRSPWVEQLPPRPPAAPIDGDGEADVVVMGAGIAGIATAWFLLKDTDRRVLLLERDRVARGATGYAAGQLVSYFERPLCRLAEQFGSERVAAAQRDVIEAWSLLDRMRKEAGAQVPVHRFPGHMGFFSIDHVCVHLENNLLRERAALPREKIRISECAEFIARIPERYAHLYEVVARSAIQELLETEDPRYTGVLSEPKGCVNAALLCEELLQHLLETYPARFQLAERTPVTKIVLGDGWAQVESGPHRVRAARVVLCSNGFVDHAIENETGSTARRPIASRVRGTVGFMAGFLESPRPPSAISYLASSRIGHGQAYFYVTRRPFEKDGRALTFTAIGGPDRELADAQAGYDSGGAFPGALLERLDAFIRPILAPGRSEPLAFDYTWHGLMGYTEDQVRVVGAEPRNPVLLYNLGCNGVGFLPSIHGGQRVARLLAGEALAPSLFDPRLS